MWLLVCGIQCHTCERKYFKISISLVSDLSLFTSTMRKSAPKEYISSKQIVLEIEKNKRLILDQKEEITNLQKKIKNTKSNNKSLEVLSNKNVKVLLQRIAAPKLTKSLTILPRRCDKNEGTKIDFLTSKNKVKEKLTQDKVNRYVLESCERWALSLDSESDFNSHLE